MKKRILSIILVIAVMLTLVPMSVFANPTGVPQITIDSTTSTQDNTTWAWDAGTNTLTLKGINMSLSSEAGSYGISIAGNLTTVNVVVTGENVISGNTGILYSGSSATVNTINFSGTGSLRVSSGQTRSMALYRTTVNFNSGTYNLSNSSYNNDNIFVIDASQTTCNFNGATVNMQAAPYGSGYFDGYYDGSEECANSNVYINSGSVTINTHGSNIATNKVVINGGTSDFHVGRTDRITISGNGGKTTINGGQVKKTGGLGAEQFQNSALNTLTLTTLTLSGVASPTAVSSLTTSPDLGYTYGTTDMKTDTNGVIYAYLRAGKTSATVVAGDNTYSGAITNNAGTLTLLSSLTDISLAAVPIAYADRAIAGIKVADLAATGTPTSGLTYSLDGSGTNDSLFQIDGTQLQIKSGATLAAQSYTVKVKVTDGTPINTYTKLITFTANVRPQTYAVSAATNLVNTNGITATATFGSSPYEAGDTATVTVKLSGTATAAGTHTIGLTSAKAGTITLPATVTKAVALGATPTEEFLYTFTMPANAVDDLVVTNTFVQAQSTTPAVTAATVAKTAATQTAIDFTLDSAIDGTWKVYDALTDGNIVNGVTASASGTTLTLTHASNIPTGTYYISVTEAGKTESTRLALTVGAYIYIAPSITTTSLPTAIAGTPYSQTLAATGDTPINWAITSGSLPDGLSLGAGSGIISGIPTQTGVYNFGVTVANGPNGNTYYDTKAFSIAVNTTTYSVSAVTNAVQANGITATATIGSSPYELGDTATVTVTLSGTAALAGTHTIGLTSAKAGTITLPATVTKAVASGATPTDAFLFTFTMPANEVDDLVVTNTFVQAQSAAPSVIATTVAKTATTQAAIDFTLDSAIEGAWKVYDAAANGNIVNGVTVSTTGTALTLTHASNVPAGTYYISVTEAGKTESTRLALTVGEYGAPIYTMTASALTEFAQKTSGYSPAPAAQTVTITNTGNQVITLTEPATTNASSNYNIGVLSTTTLAVNGTATFTVQPKTGLAVGTYAETIRIVGSNSAVAIVSARFSVSAANSGSGSGSGSSATVTQPASKGVEIIVNGVPQTAATSSTETVNNRTITTVTIDDSKIKGKLDSESLGSTVVIPINSKSDVLVGQLNGETIKNMETKEAVLEIKSETVTYTLPAIQINIDRVSEQFGSQVALNDIKVNVTIEDASSNTTRVVQDTANKNNYQIIVKPVEFSINCVSGGRTIEVSKFNGYVERTIAIPNGIDPSKVTTGIVLNADGTFSHVPTAIVKINGKYFAKINSLTNSTYSVIYNKVEFKDVEAHWAKEAINDMGSRLVIDGIGDNNFEPDKDITRAEFAAIIVKALGLRPEIGNSTFTDVNDSAWYSAYIKTAFEYNVISGYGDGKFGPLDKITREQAMTMIARAMKITGLKVEINSDEAEMLLTGFGDLVQSSAWAKEGVVSCVKAGIVSGKNGNMLAPKDNITRAEVAVIVRKLLQKSKII